MAKGILQPNGSRMKRLIADHGREWEIVRIALMPCFNGEPGVLIRADDGKLSNVKLEDILI